MTLLKWWRQAFSGPHQPPSWSEGIKGRYRLLTAADVGAEALAHLKKDAAMLRELHSVVEDVQQDLLQALRIAQHYPGNALRDVVGYLRAARSHILIH